GAVTQGTAYRVFEQGVNEAAPGHAGVGLAGAALRDRMAVGTGAMGGPRDGLDDPGRLGGGLASGLAPGFASGARAGAQIWQGGRFHHNRGRDLDLAGRTQVRAQHLPRALALSSLGPSADDEEILGARGGYVQE